MKKVQPQDFPNPFSTFTVWWHEEVTSSPSKHPSACVFSTIGLDGFPNARTVALKEVHHPYLIVTTSLTSKKALEIKKNNKVALTFWWEHTQRQIRIQGLATQIDEATADFHFKERSKPAQVVSRVSAQSGVLSDPEALKKSYLEMLIDSKEKEIIRPKDWGGYHIFPIKFEFLEFEENRFHNRVEYTLEGDIWKVARLQP